jgi:hypothetical protein
VRAALRRVYEGGLNQRSVVPCTGVFKGPWAPISALGWCTERLECPATELVAGHLLGGVAPRSVPIANRAFRAASPYRDPRTSIPSLTTVVNAGNRPHARG